MEECERESSLLPLPRATKLALVSYPLMLGGRKRKKKKN